MLRKGQKELVETYRQGYCGVPAIPGGGKTFALTQWAVEVLTEGINKPGKVLIVTYMNSAVNNFKQRISAALEKILLLKRIRKESPRSTMLFIGLRSIGLAAIILPAMSWKMKVL